MQKSAVLFPPYDKMVKKGMCVMIKGFVRVVIYLNFTILFILVIAINGLGFHTPILPQCALYVASAVFLGLEAVNLFLLYRKGILYCVTFPIFWTEMLLYYLVPIERPALIVWLAALIFLIKGIEICLAIIKRRKGLLCSEDRFSDYAEATIVMTMAFDFARLIFMG